MCNKRINIEYQIILYAESILTAECLVQFPFSAVLQRILCGAPKILLFFYTENTYKHIVIYIYVYVYVCLCICMYLFI